MTDAVIIDAVRTPGGKRNGKLRNWHAADLASEPLQALVERNDLDPALVDDVIMGCVMQVGEQSLNVGRNAVLAAGFPESVPATTIDRQCGSSQQALHFGAQGVIAGAYDMVIGAGVEVMTRTPMGSSVVRELGYPFGPRMMARYADRGGLVGQGEGAELIAEQWGLSREDLDEFSVRSHQRAAQATAEGRFERELIPVAIKDDERNDTDELITTDEGIRPDSSVETLANLKPAFRPENGQGHRRQLVADHRRRLGRAGHERRPRPPRWASPPGPGSTPSPWPAATRSPCSPAPSRPPAWPSSGAS